MKRIKDYTSFILEKYMILNDIYTKYYSNIDKPIFDKIVNADPTSKGDKMGTYSKWLLNLFINKKLKLEDLYKATEYLETFHFFKHKLPIKDINKIDSLPTLFKLVEPFLQTEDAVFTNEDERKLTGQFKQVFKNDKYRIIVPLTLEASQYFGQDTEWCTTKPDMFKHYTKEQTDELDEYCLYILYTENPDDRLQFHFQTRQFMDVYDSGIDIIDFFLSNEDIAKFFSSLFNITIFINYPHDVIKEYAPKYDIKIEYVDLEDYDNEFNDWKNDNMGWKNEYDIVASTDFEYEEHPMDGSMNLTITYISKNKEMEEKFINMIKHIYNLQDFRLENRYYKDCNTLNFNL